MNLKDLRKQAGLSVKEVANKLNLVIQSVYRYEKGDRELPLVTAYNLARIYDVTLDEIAEAVINKNQHDL